MRLMTPSHALTLLIMLGIMLGIHAAAQSQTPPQTQPPQTPPSRARPDEASPPQESALTREAKARQEDQARQEDARRSLKTLDDERALHQRLNLRMGPTFNGMWSSEQGRPFVYPYVGLRYKPDDLYLDLHLPAIMALADAAQWAIQDRLIGVPSAFNLFERANGPPQYIMIEVAHARLGQSFPVLLGASPTSAGVPLTLHAGLVGVADWVLFEARTLGRPFEDLDDINGQVRVDPYVLGLGLFVGASWRTSRTHLELALEVSRDLLSPSDSYDAQPGWILGAELELTLEILAGFGMFLRVRQSVYTHLDDLMVWGTALTTGVTLSL